MAKKNEKAIKLAKNEAKKSIKPFCEESAELVEIKNKVEELRPLAVAELQAKLNTDPDTKDFTGMVVCMYDDQMYKIRVQRPAAHLVRPGSLHCPEGHCRRQEDHACLFMACLWC